MNELFKKAIIAAAMATSLFMVGLQTVPVALAQTAPADVGNAGTANPDPTKGGSTFQLVSCTGVVDPRTGQGVPCDYNQVVFTASRIISFVLYITIPIVLGIILYTGFTYLTANGDSGKIANAKKMLKPIAIGVFFILAAYLIVYKLILGNLLAGNVGDVSKSTIIGAGGN
jgi:hypothetical protein